jgi:hypothetical protein
MNKQTKTLLISLAGALVLLYALMPKNKNKSGFSNATGNKYPEPKLADDKAVKDKENAVIGLQAMRSAMDNNEPESELKKLSGIIFKEHGIKVIPNKKTGLLRAMSKDGKVLAEEEKV